jgi:Domain of unknown function (DUF4249)
MSIIKIYLLLFAGCFALPYIFSSCTKPVTINLPPDENRMVVEGYLTPNKRLAVALQISTGITSTLPLQLASRAFVTISHAGITDTLRNIPFIDSANGRAYNYSSPKLMTEDFTNTYTLSVYDSTTGNKYTATTQMLLPVPIDSVNHALNINNKASIGVKFTDPPATANYYRRFAFTKETDPDRRANFRFTDALFNGRDFSIFTGFGFDKGDSITIRLYNMNRTYFDFLESINVADDAASNPLAQPVFAKGNISGDALGIFTGLNYAEKKYVVPK